MKKPLYSQKHGNGGVAELLKELWNAAVALRGNIEPADYKRYVLPLIFLRFLSLRFEKRRAEIDTEIADPKSELHTTDEQLALVLRRPRPLSREPGLPRARGRALGQYHQDRAHRRREAAPGQHPRAAGKNLPGAQGPPIYAGSNLDKENIAGLINLFSKDIFRFETGGIDRLGQVYEYFIGEFASSEGKRGGEFFTPESIVKLLVAMLEPTAGKLFDPCVGSGGMFVQSDHFAKHSGKLSFFGQEAKDFTYRLCRLNLFIHGLDGDIRLGSSYDNDQHADLKADYILANEPFNDGAKGEKGWGADRIDPKDARLRLPGSTQPLPLTVRNANTMWMLHFLSHLKDPTAREAGGTAGFVMATGELSNSETARLAVRRALVEGGFVDCIVTLTGQLFANTQIPCALWFLSKNRGGEKGTGNAGGFRRRKDEVLFIDGRKLGALIPGSRKQKQLTAEEIERIAGVYQQFRKTGAPAAEPGFCAVATVEKIREFGYALTPGRYVGASEDGGEDESFEERLPRLIGNLTTQLDESERLGKEVRAQLEQFIDVG